MLSTATDLRAAGSPRFGESSAVFRRLLTLDRCRVAPLGSGLSGGEPLLGGAAEAEAPAEGGAPTPARTSSTFEAA